MLTLDYALQAYTDEINEYKEINLNYYKLNLSSSNYVEFEELIQFINLFKSSQTADRYDKVFEKVNEYKENLFSLQSASNFRSTEEVPEDIKAEIDKMFDEEFDDDTE